MSDHKVHPVPKEVENNAHIRNDQYLAMYDASINRLARALPLDAAVVVGTGTVVVERAGGSIALLADPSEP